jgi:hypothetical protein
MQNDKGIKDEKVIGGKDEKIIGGREDRMNPGKDEKIIGGREDRVNPGKDERTIGSKEVVKAAILLALTSDRVDEKQLQKDLLARGIHSAAVDYGGEFISSVMKIIERAVVSAKREGVIKECHSEEGAVAGAAREALSQVMPKALGLNVGGKIGVARCGEHVSVAVFFGIGLLHLNEVAIGTGHRVV